MTSEKRSTAFQTFITIILYASLIVLGYKYYFATPKEVVVPEDVSGEKFIVPKSILERTPLVKNIPSFFFKADEKKLLMLPLIHFLNPVLQSRILSLKLIKMASLNNRHRFLQAKVSRPPWHVCFWQIQKIGLILN